MVSGPRAKAQDVTKTSCHQTATKKGGDGECRRTSEEDTDTRAESLPFPATIYYSHAWTKVGAQAQGARGRLVP
jgi:hypothetical protein